MPDYQTTKFYMLTVPTNPQILPYIGATTDTLGRRMSKHRTSTTTTARALFATGKPVQITLLESFPCTSKAELSVREQHYLSAIPCVNQRRAGTICSESRLQRMREYTHRWGLWKQTLVGSLGHAYFD
jgi:hypothetical protein